MNPPDPPPTPLGLVHEGWHHLRAQRPLAAWASWQRALRLAPDDPAALRAVETLERAEEVPAAARAAYRFQTPADDAQRARWNARLRGRGLDDLDAASAAFEGLARDDPADAHAWLNLALCRAWLGRNAEAIDALDRVVTLLAPADNERAADAWTLAEVLRLGGGAEALADDFRYVWTAGAPAGGFDDRLFERWPHLAPADVPSDPLTGSQPVDGATVYEWLDRAPLPPGAATARGDELPRVLAAVIRTPALLRLSSPDPSGFSRLDDPGLDDARRALGPARRERTPLPLAWADAALAAFRLPAGLEPRDRDDLTRSAVEHYYENLWVHRERVALGGRSPLETARSAARGDLEARARLSAVVRFREQLGTRPSHAPVYQGYPFDRLRRRLGLLPGASASGAVDPDDPSCMSEPELDALDPAALDDHRLVDAFLSASHLGDDARTSRTAAEVVRRGPSTLGRLDPVRVFGPLVRESLRRGETAQALEWIDRARSTAEGPPARTFAVWSAELHARSGSPSTALHIYQNLLERPDADAALALDAAETLLDNGHDREAAPLLLEARDRARDSGDDAVLRKAEDLLSRTVN